MIGPLFAALLEISGTFITVHPGKTPEVIAEVWVKNQATNTDKDNGVYELSIEGQVVEVEFIWNDGTFGADRITLKPPLSIVCEPASCSILVLETFDGVILLKPFSGF